MLRVLQKFGKTVREKPQALFGRVGQIPDERVEDHRLVVLEAGSGEGTHREPLADYEQQHARMLRVHAVFSPRHDCEGPEGREELACPAFGQTGLWRTILV